MTPLERVLATRSGKCLGVVEAPELTQDGEDVFVIHVYEPMLRDHDWATAAQGQWETLVRMFIRVSRDAEGRQLFDDKHLQEVMRGGSDLKAVIARVGECAMPNPEEGAAGNESSAQSDSTVIS